MIEQILAYQNVDAKLRKIEVELGGSEERKKAVSAKKFLDVAPENINKLNARAGDLETEYKNALSEMKKFNEQQEELAHAIDSLEDQTEAEYLSKKAEKLAGETKALEAKLLKLAEDIASVIKEFNNVRAQMKNAKAQYEEFGKKYNELKASRQAEKESIESELATLKAKADPALMERYLKKRANKIFPILYEVNGKICGACNMELSMADLGKLKNGEIIDCETCGRLLYLSNKK